MIKKIKGTGVAIVTPFHKDGSIDFLSLRRLLEHVISNGIDFIVALGTTGESVVLNSDEKNAVINFVVEITEDKVPVVVGIGGNNTAEVVRTLEAFDYEGVSAILSVTPYYNKPQQKGLYGHYKAIAQSAPKPVILYNVPDRTNVNLHAETTLQLAHDFKNIIGVKEASRNMAQISYIIQHRPEKFLVFSGDDATTLPILALGADGVISVSANALPKQFSSMVNFGLKGDFKNGRLLHQQISSFMCDIFEEGSPSGIKAALDILGITKSFTRLPLVGVSKNNYSKIKEAIDKILNPVKI
ncbi:MAG: 4-hydroxy-tetrahydrodipicolinate synthase [Bacteroidales bacterium]|nr:4-hydroxy-tetrahydrodipicolinate synthase [Bacteroidales bacterium]